VHRIISWNKHIAHAKALATATLIRRDLMALPSLCRKNVPLSHTQVLYQQKPPTTPVSVQHR
jgi:hypothetical protein